MLVNRQQMHRQLMEENENVKVPSLMYVGDLEKRLSGRGKKPINSEIPWKDMKETLPIPYLKGIVLGWEDSSVAKIIATQEEMFEFSPSIYLKGDMNF